MLTKRLLRTSQVLALISVNEADEIFDLRLLAMKGITLGLIRYEGNALDSLLKQAAEDVQLSRFGGSVNRSYVAIYELRPGDDLKMRWVLMRSEVCDSTEAMSSVLPS